MSEANCIFCKIAQKEVPAEFVYEDEDIVVFRDINPKAPVHVLIVPRRHIETVNDVCNDNTELMGKMICLAPRIAKETDTASGYKLLFNVGKKGGQIVPHIHLHLMGGWQ